MENQYFKTTTGLSANTFVAKATAYTNDATFDLFVANAVEGEMGVFLVYDASGPTTYDPSKAVANASDAPLQAGDKFFIAQKRNGQILSTPITTYGDVVAKKTAYVAPVKQVTNIGFDGTAGSLNTGTLVGGQILTIGVKETTPGNMPYPTWNYEEIVKPNDTLIGITSRLVKQINSDSTGQNRDGKIVGAELLTNGTFVASSGGAATVTKGSNVLTIVEQAGATADAGKYSGDGSTIVAGQYIRIGGTTAAFPVYKVVSITGGGTALATIVLDTPYQGASGSVLAANLLVNTVAPTEAGLKLTSLDFSRHFKVFLTEDTSAADVVYTTPYKEGAGTYLQVKQMETEGYIRDGYAYDNMAFKEDFGSKINFADSSLTYDIFYLAVTAKQESKAVVGSTDILNRYIIIASPSGVAPTINLDGMFV